MRSINSARTAKSLQLHGIVVGKVEGTISGVLGGTVKLRVNGGPADLNDLKQIDPKMVRRVEYHDMPSMRYGTGINNLTVKLHHNALCSNCGFIKSYRLLLQYYWQDLKQIDPKMVRRVEYHDMPSMRYGKVEAVIDLYVKRQGFGGSGRVDASHSAMSPNGSPRRKRTACNYHEES